MIKMSVEIPDIVKTDNPEDLKAFCVAVKQFCEELARRAIGGVDSLKDAIPAQNDLNENELTPYDNGAGTQGYYVKIKGTRRFIAAT